jgi:hypothetical protein
VQSLGIKVADFLAVPNSVATTTARSPNRSGHDSTNANEGSTSIVFGTGLDKLDEGLPSDLKNERLLHGVA